MNRVLVTAFGPYDRWTENSSWAALEDLTSWYDGDAQLVTRRYPVDLVAMTEALRQDLSGAYSVAIHLGQAPGSPIIKLEAVGLNVKTDGTPIVVGGPDALRSRLPLGRCAEVLCRCGMPAEISHHAGTYLCNAAMYLSQHFAKHAGLETPSVFVHLPLTPGESARHPHERLPSMSTPLSAAAVAKLIDMLTGE